MFELGISGDLLNSDNKPCFGEAPLKILTRRPDIKFSWMDKFNI